MCQDSIGSKLRPAYIVETYICILFLPVSDFQEVSVPNLLLRSRYVIVVTICPPPYSPVCCSTSYVLVILAFLALQQTYFVFFIENCVVSCLFSFFAYEVEVLPTVGRSFW